MYIVDPAEQIQIMKEMNQLRRDMENYEVFFHHPFTNQTWKSFFPRASEGDLGRKLLRHDPLPERLSDLMSICLTEEVPQNAIGLGIELSVSVEKWLTIFDILEENYSKYHSGQIRLFLKYLKVENFRESLERMNTTPEKIDLTEKKLKRLVWKSRKLKLKSRFL